MRLFYLGDRFDRLARRSHVSAPPFDRLSAGYGARGTKNDPLKPKEGLNGSPVFHLPEQDTAAYPGLVETWGTRHSAAFYFLTSKKEATENQDETVAMERATMRMEEIYEFEADLYVRSLLAFYDGGQLL